MLDLLIFCLALVLPFYLTSVIAADYLIPALERRWGLKLAKRLAFILPVLFLLSYHGVLFEAMWQLSQGISLSNSTQTVAATSGLFGVILYLKKVRARYHKKS